MDRSVRERLAGAHHKPRAARFTAVSDGCKRLAVDEERRAFGMVIERALTLAAMTKLEVSHAMGFPAGDQSAISKWIAGTEPAQIARLYRVRALRGPLGVAIAQDAGDGVTVRTVLELDRRLA